MNVTFALPSVPAIDMSRDDQGALVVNQATAIIVAKWLENQTAAGVDVRVSGTGVPDSLEHAINSVQAALASF